MNSLIFKSLIGTLSISSATVMSLYVFTDLFKSKSEIQNKNVEEKVDIFVTAEEGTKKVNQEDGNDTNIKCKFKDWAKMNEEFDCEFFTYLRAADFTTNKHTTISNFSKQIINKREIVNKYNKIRVDQKIWDEWSTSENKTKKIEIYTGNNKTQDLTLLFGMKGNELLTTNNIDKNYFLGKVNQISEENSADKLEKSNSNYQCSNAREGTFADCTIYKIATNDVSDLTTAIFNKTLTEAETVNRDKYYLIDVGSTKYESKFIQTKGNTDTKKKMEIIDLQRATIHTEMLFLLNN